jgi:hypothetical protein
MTTEPVHLWNPSDPAAPVGSYVAPPRCHSCSKAPIIVQRKQSSKRHWLDSRGFMHMADAIRYAGKMRDLSGPMFSPYDTRILVYQESTGVQAYRIVAQSTEPAPR